MDNIFQGCDNLKKEDLAPFANKNLINDKEIKISTQKKTYMD